MKTTDLKDIRRAARKLLDAHSGAIGFSPEGDDMAPCSCPGCVLAEKWLRRASVETEAQR